MEQLSLNVRVENLFEASTSVAQLRSAYEAVRRNGGAPGIDGVSVEEYGKDLEENLSLLSREVREWRYKPMPVRRVRIPKPGTNKERILGVPCVKDRVLQYSLKMSLEPIFEKKFSESSYGFRPGRSQQDAIEQAQKLVKEGKEWVVDLDLATFFDTINHDRAIYLVSQEVADNRILRLIGMTLRSGVVENGRFEPTLEGAVQGSPLSPLLSNIVLHELDMELERRGLSFCRYADDSNIFVRTPRAAERVKESITKFIEGKLKLKVNPDKSQAAKSDGVKFLGMTIAKGMAIISVKSMQRAIKKVRELIPRGTHVPLEKQIEKVNRWYLGWSSYYKMTETPSQLKAIEARIRVRFRAQFIRAQKRRRHLLKKLLSLGARRHTAYKAIQGNHGVWKTAHTHAAETAWNRNWFSLRGLKTLSDAGLPHWKSLNVYVKLT